MNYWLNLFTGTTWNESRKAGGNICGFREGQRKNVERIQPGDRLVCYVTGVMRWVGIIEVIGLSTDQSDIWASDSYPVRLAGRTLVAVEPEYGVPMEQLEGQVDFYESSTDRPTFKMFLRRSPSRFKRPEDGELIHKLIKEAHSNPIRRPVDQKKLARKPRFLSVPFKKGSSERSTVVSIPDSNKSDNDQTIETSQETIKAPTRHTEIQYYLLTLGYQLGLKVWVARNDRSREFKGQALGDLPGNVAKLPAQFNDATNRTIELIDVLWLRDNAIVAAFEVEATTSVYSGLLRMSDLLSLQPNIKLDLFLVAPDERRDKVRQELLRPTFSYKDKPLNTTCGFLGFDTLIKKMDALQTLGATNSLKPDYIKTITEYFDVDEESD
jgi:hypothetical protein